MWLRMKICTYNSLLYFHVYAHSMSYSHTKVLVEYDTTGALSIIFTSRCQSIQNCMQGGHFTKIAFLPIFGRVTFWWVTERWWIQNIVERGRFIKFAFSIYHQCYIVTTVFKLDGKIDINLKILNQYPLSQNACTWFHETQHFLYFWRKIRIFLWNISFYALLMYTNNR